MSIATRCLCVRPHAAATQRRRALLGAAFAVVALPALAQPTAARKPRIGWIGISTDAISRATTLEPFRHGLRELGWVEGETLAPIELRYTEGKDERYPALIAELLRLDLALLVTLGVRAAMLAKEATQSLPVVAIAVDDPVQMGLVASFARPGGNITGVSAVFQGLPEKRLQLLKDIVPAAKRLAIVYNPATVPPKVLADAVPRWEAGLGIAASLAAVRGADDFDAAFAALARERVDGVQIFADPMVWRERARLGELCLKHRLPSIWSGAAYLDAGGTASYQGDFPAMFRRGAALVDKILRGAKPGEIAFEQGTKLELAVSLKGARAIGITIPQSVLLQADVVIE